MVDEGFPTQTVQEALIALTHYIRREPDIASGQIAIPNAAMEARLLLAHAMGVPPVNLTLQSYDKLDGDIVEKAIVFAGRRRVGEPTSYIVGRRGFYIHNFLVNEHVLDPRPETEILVEVALQSSFEHMLDLGTGSGCILASLLFQVVAATGVGTDVSEAALAVASRNSAGLKVDDRATFLQSDWFTKVEGRFDLIVSNPPYIAANEMDDLQPEVRLHEPRIALTDEADGLTAYRKIVAGAPAHLTKGGRLILEIGPTQATPVCKMMENAGFDRVTVAPDLDGRDRVVSGYWPEDGPQPSA